MPAALLTAAPYVLNALGGVFGKKKKYIDPEELRQKYGPRAVAKDTQDLSNFILNSPYGQQLMSQAATTGQNFQTEMASNAAQSGLDPSSGGESGASTFATGAASQAQNGLERQTKSNIWQAAMPIAAAQNARYGELALSNNDARNQDPSTFQKIAAAAGQLAQGGAAAHQTAQGNVQPAAAPAPSIYSRGPGAAPGLFRKPGELEQQRF